MLDSTGMVLVRSRELTCVEMCAGAGGQALGLEAAGFTHAALVEIDADCCATLTANRPGWPVIQEDLNLFDGLPFAGVDLLAGGLPCPPFSVAGQQLGSQDERNLFPAALRLVREIRPRAILIENVKGLLNGRFTGYRSLIRAQLQELGYWVHWRLLNASDYGVPQLRPRSVLVAIREDQGGLFAWPQPKPGSPPTVGEILYDLMAASGWEGAAEWARKANTIAPTIVGGSKKHGGADLGPTRSKAAWRKLGVDGKGISNDPPDPGFTGMPRLTIRMVARLQGFPDDWVFAGKKTSTYRQVGNAFPPPVARSVAEQIRMVLSRDFLREEAG